MAAFAHTLAGGLSCTTTIFAVPSPSARISSHSLLPCVSSVISRNNLPQFCPLHSRAVQNLPLKYPFHVMKADVRSYVPSVTSTDRRQVVAEEESVIHSSEQVKEKLWRLGEEAEAEKRGAAMASWLAALCILVTASIGVAPAEARRPEGVNKPELLPKEFTRVIDVAGFLSAGQEARLGRDLERLEQDTGFKLRVLAQNFPETPGLAIRDYWGVDDQTIVFVADPSLSGNIINFNVGATVDLSVPRSFWSRVAGKYGNMFYWRENGEDSSIEAAVLAIDACLREPPGPRQCSDIK